MTLPLWAYGAIASTLTAFAGGWTIRDWKADSEALDAADKAQTQYVAMSQALADQSLALEAVTQSLRTYERRDRETIREIYRDKIIPSDCAVPPAGVSVLDNAVSRANAAATGQPVRAVPDAP